MGQSQANATYGCNLVAAPDSEVPLEGDDTSALIEEVCVDITNPYNASEIRIESQSGNLTTLLDRLQYDEIDMAPEFQRLGGIWTDGAQSRLIESFMLRIPIPAFYFDGTNNNRWLVVDGLQRLTAIKRFIIDNELRLSGLEYLKQYNGARFSDLPRPLQRSAREAPIVWYLIMPGTPDDVKFDVFRRINTGGLPLSAQEIRHALNGKPVTDVIRQLAISEEFKKATANGISAKRMDDRECVTRFLVFATFPPETYDKNDFDRFLNKGMRELNKNPALLEELMQRFTRAMCAAERIFGSDAFRKRYERGAMRFPVNKSLFETWSVNLDSCTDAELDLLAERKEIVMDKFIELCCDSKFEKSVSQGTGSIARVKHRFASIRELIRGILNDK